MALPNFRAAQVETGGAPTVREHTCGATVGMGDMVTLKTDGFVDEAADDSVVLGIALKAGVVTDVIPVLLATPTTILSGVYTGTWNVNLIGDFVAIDHDQIDLAGGTADLARVVGLDATDSGRVLFSVIPAGSQAPGGSAEPLA